jgi:hypothetical protein
VKDAGKSAEKYAKAKELARQFWARCVDEVVRFANKPITKADPESPVDKAARRTATATRAIAVFTIILAFVAYMQYIELRDSGIESTGQMDQMIHEYRSQVAQMSKQAAETHDLAGHMKHQADRTRTIANQAVVQANAAKSAAKTADKSLHISERAYLVLSPPQHDFPHNIVYIPITNTGHIPSGIATIVTHVLVFRLDNPTAKIYTVTDDAVLEKHWSSATYVSIPVGNEFSQAVHIHTAIADQIDSGKMGVAIASILTYNDGFHDDPDQIWTFCDSIAYSADTKRVSMAPCDDPVAELKTLTNLDGYPDAKNQEK